jgi:hypothetical protein
MENKKTAVFGIYTTVAAADLATDTSPSVGAAHRSFSFAE